MAYNLLNSPELLKAGAFRKKDPEFAAAVRELEMAHKYADAMLADGKLTQQEADHFEAHLYGKLIDALPVEQFHELMKNGGMDHLQSLAGYEGDHDAGDIEDTRKEIEAKIKADALDEFWVAGRITNEHYTKANRDVELRHDEAMDDTIADEEYDKGAMNYFIERDADPGHDRDLNAYLADKYGDKPGPDTPRNSSSDAPEGYVEHNIEVFAGSPAQRTAARESELAAQRDSENLGITSYD